MCGCRVGIGGFSMGCMRTFVMVVNTGTREEMVDITSELRRRIAESGVTDGVATVFCPHTTAGVIINEAADPDVRRDIMTYLNRLVPRTGDYRHSEGNSDGHIKAMLTGCSLQIIVTEGKPALGTWQGLYLCEFDGPRRREIWVRVMGDQS